MRFWLPTAAMAQPSQHLWEQVCNFTPQNSLNDSLLLVVVGRAQLVHWLT